MASRSRLGGRPQLSPRNRNGEPPTRNDLPWASTFVSPRRAPATAAVSPEDAASDSAPRAGRPVWRLAPPTALIMLAAGTCEVDSPQQGYGVRHRREAAG